MTKSSCDYEKPCGGKSCSTINRFFRVSFWLSYVAFVLLPFLLPFTPIPMYVLCNIYGKERTLHDRGRSRLLLP